MDSSHAYLFLEFAIALFFISFGGTRELIEEVRSKTFWIVVGGLAGLWLLIDHIAVGFGLWAFPPGGTLHFRAMGLPLEEHLLFFLHSFLCLLLLQLMGSRRTE